MKTVKQIREEYESRILGKNLEEIMIEANVDGLSDKNNKSLSRVSPIPSAKEMPMMLIFRRVQYRVFPNRQVVALYYSSMVNKYLSIPFGPNGNLNLSESTLHDQLDERWWQEYLPGYKDSKEAKDKWKKGDKKGAIWSGVKSVSKGLATGAAVSGAAGLGKFALGKLAGAGASAAGAAAGAAAGSTAGNAASKAADFAANPLKGFERLGGNKPQQSITPTKSSWSKPKNLHTTHNSILKQADVLRAKAATRSSSPMVENKISDLRKMLSENIPNKDISINGKTITINSSIAKRIVETYDSLNVKNRKIFEHMINTDMDSFKRLINFTIKQ